MAIELPEGYYLTNFLELVDYVVEQYADLLSPKERAFHNKFHSLDVQAQKLYVRMLTRKGSAFRQCKLEYQEIPDTADAAVELEKNDFIQINPQLDADEIVELFNKTEWLNMLAALELDQSTLKELKKLKRAELDEVIFGLADEFDINSLIEEIIYQICDPESFDIFKLLFFGNLNQDLTEFVLRDLGLYRFENYTIDKQARLFSDKKQIDNYLEYYQLISDLDNILADDDTAIVELHHRLPEPNEKDSTLNRRIQRVNLLLARQLERLESLDDALTIYQKCHIPPARERTARILIKQNKIDSSLDLCRQIIAQPYTESEAIFATDFGYRTAKKHNIDWSPPSKYLPSSEKIKIEQSGEGVEIDTANYLSQFGECFFVENGLFLSVFGLHFWELIFAPVKGAFTNPFQIRPHDLYEDDFVAKRQHLFDRLNEQVGSLDVNISHILERRKSKEGTATPFIFWELIDETLIRTALDSIPNEHWQVIFDRLWADIRANRSGFPDLILFKDDGSYELIEVKGPGDRLQKNQIRWMEHFNEHDIPHRVIHVEWR